MTALRRTVRTASEEPRDRGCRYPPSLCKPQEVADEDKMPELAASEERTIQLEPEKRSLIFCHTAGHALHPLSVDEEVDIIEELHQLC